MRKRALLAAAATLLGTLAGAPAAHAAPAHGSYGSYGQGLDHCTTVTTSDNVSDTASLACHFDVPPGTYDVTVTLGGDSAGSTAVSGETRRALLAETTTAAGQRVRRSFTVDVRDPEGEPTGPAGSPGLDLVLGGSAPRVTALRVTPPVRPAGSSASVTRRSATSRATLTPAGARSSPPI